jgi:hypothetical protein
MNPTNPEHVDAYVSAILHLQAVGFDKAASTLICELGQMMYEYNTRQGPYHNHPHTENHG